MLQGRTRTGACGADRQSTGAESHNSPPERILIAWIEADCIHGGECEPNECHLSSAGQAVDESIGILAANKRYSIVGCR